MEKLLKQPLNKISVRKRHKARKQQKLLQEFVAEIFIIFDYRTT